MSEKITYKKVMDWGAAVRLCAAPFLISFYSITLCGFLITSIEKKPFTLEIPIIAFASCILGTITGFSIVYYKSNREGKPICTKEVVV